jgi:hypothetical protein
MSLGRRPATALPLLALLGLSGCATLNQLRALEDVDFSIDRLAQVRLAGVDVTRVRSFSDLGFADGAALAAAVADRDLPLFLELQILAENPAENYDARLTEMEWTLLLEDRETVSGRLDREIMLPRAQDTTFPLAIELNLIEFFDGNARELYNLAASLAGVGSEATDVELRAMPVIQTPLGRIAYPEPIRIRRTVGG